MNYIQPLHLTYTPPKSADLLLVDYRMPILEAIRDMSQSRCPDGSPGVRRTLLGIDDCVKYRLLHPCDEDKVVLSNSFLETSCAVVGLSPTQWYVCTSKSAGLQKIISDALHSFTHANTPPEFRYSIDKSFIKSTYELFEQDMRITRSVLPIPSDIRTCLVEDPFSQTDWRMSVLWPFLLSSNNKNLSEYTDLVFSQSTRDADYSFGFDIRTMHTGMRFCHIGDIVESRSVIGLSEIGSFTSHCVGSLLTINSSRVVGPQKDRLGHSIGSLVASELRRTDT
jgi:hypothetical protein